MLRRLGMLLFVAAFAIAGTVAAQRIVLEMPSWQAEEPGFAEWWQGVIQDFQEMHPEVEVRMHQITFGQYVDQLTIRFAAGNPPDIVHLPARNFPLFAAEGWLEPLDAWLSESDIPDAWTPLQADMMWDDQTYGVLLMGYGSIFFYNEQILSDAGVDVPTTPEAFLEVVRETTDVDAGIFGFAGTTIEHPGIYVDVSRWLAGQDIDWVVDGAYAFTDPQVVAAIEQYREAIGSSPTGLTTAAGRQLFIDGRIATMMDGPWVVALLAQAPDDVRPHLRIDRTPFPYTAGGTSNSLHIPAGADPERQQLAWEFIELAGSPKWQDRYTALTKSPAPRAGAASEATLQESPELELINAMAAEAVDLFPQHPTLRQNYTEFANLFAEAMMRLITTNVATEQVLADLQRELNNRIPLAQ